jgi:hypothetical protein
MEYFEHKMGEMYSQAQQLFHNYTIVINV